MPGLRSYLRATRRAEALATLLGLALAGCFGQVSDEPSAPSTTPISPLPGGQDTPTTPAEDTTDSIAPQDGVPRAGSPSVDGAPASTPSVPVCSCSTDSPFIQLDRAGQLITFTQAPPKAASDQARDCIPPGPVARALPCSGNWQLVGCNEDGCLGVSAQPNGSAANLTWLQNESNTLLQISGGQLSATSEDGVVRGTFSFIGADGKGPSGNFVVCKLQGAVCR